MRGMAFTILTVGAVGVAGLAPTGLQAAPGIAAESYRNQSAQVMLNRPLPPKAVLALSDTERVSKPAANAKIVVPQA